MKHKQFTDFDAFANAVIDADITMMLQKPKYYSWRITQVNLAEINVQVGMEGSGNITEGTSRLDGYIIFVLLNNADSHAANGKALDKYSVAIMEPGCDFCVRSTTEHHWCSIFVPNHKLVVGGTFVEPSSDEKTTCRVTSVNSQLAKQFLNTVQSIMTTAANCQEFESSLAETCAIKKTTKTRSFDYWAATNEPA